MLSSNNPFTLLSLEISDHSFTIAYEVDDGVGLAQNSITLNTMYNNVSEEEFEELRKLMYVLNYHALWTLIRPNYKALLKVFRGAYFDEIASLLPDSVYFDDEPGEKLPEDIAYYIDRYPMRVDSFVLKELQSTCTMKITRMMQGVEYKITLPALSVFSDSRGKKNIGYPFFAALQEDLRRIQDMCQNFATNSVYSQKRQLDLFQKGEYISRIGGDEGDNMSDAEIKDGLQQMMNE